MTDIAIKVEGVGKQYQIGTSKSGSLRESFTQLFRKSNGKDDSFWALDDLNFEIKKGEAVGVIGKNGAGKSTLLKVLSRITEPTNGKITINGRMASLLEVGTGFHPELSGRENIFMNGTILGMRRHEIKAKFDEIVAFSGVEKFIDTPVKHYSSGMYVRLAFAVAAHLEPEILIVDEVLAVGDAEFQKKCLGKMGEVAGQGRTVLFVSHNMAAIKKLCQKTLVLEKGNLSFLGDVDLGISKYENSSNIDRNINSSFAENLEKCKTEGLEVLDVSIFNPGSNKEQIKSGDSLRIKIRYRSSKSFLSPAFVFQFKDHIGQEVFRLSTQPISGFDLSPLYPIGEVSLTIPRVPLVKGDYFIDFGFVHESVEWFFKVEDFTKLTVEEADVYSSGLALDRSRGLIWVDHFWEHSYAE